MDTDEPTDTTCGRARIAFKKNRFVTPRIIEGIGSPSLREFKLAKSGSWIVK
jgi:hypothetical protein